MGELASNPRYMRARQKIMALRPEHRAILSTVSAAPEFAAESMRKGIRSMLLKTQNTNRERGFKSLEKERGRRNTLADRRAGMADRALDYGKGEGKKAFALSLGNLGLSAYGAHKQNEYDDNILDTLETMGTRYDVADVNSTWGLTRDDPYKGSATRRNLPTF